MKETTIGYNRQKSGYLAKWWDLTIRVDVILIIIKFVLIITRVKAKGDHRSKLSNLSNWKEEGLKTSGRSLESNPCPPRQRHYAPPTEL